FPDYGLGTRYSSQWHTTWENRIENFRRETEFYDLMVTAVCRESSMIRSADSYRTMVGRDNMFSQYLTQEEIKSLNHRLDYLLSIVETCN
ncbi:MAG: hypothetical protein R3A11_10240, partial [Bdellovibrionota bacterium]